MCCCRCSRAHDEAIADMVLAEAILTEHAFRAMHPNLHPAVEERMIRLGSLISPGLNESMLAYLTKLWRLAK